MITLKDLVDYVLDEHEDNIYYFDVVNEIAYHVHFNEKNEPKFFKNTGKTIRTIDEKTFINAINKCNGNSITENTYYNIIK